ncbi:hypothetical protein RFD67_005531 [Klebsiella pneumoniae]
MVTQSLADFGRYSYKPRPAFQDWIERLKTGERLPRGRYFVGKKPGGGSKRESQKIPSFRMMKIQSTPRLT